MRSGTERSLKLGTPKWAWNVDKSRSHSLSKKHEETLRILSDIRIRPIFELPPLIVRDFCMLTCPSLYNVKASAHVTSRCSEWWWLALSYKNKKYSKNESSEFWWSRQKFSQIGHQTCSASEACMLDYSLLSQKWNSSSLLWANSPLFLW